MYVLIFLTVMLTAIYLQEKLRVRSMFGRRVDDILQRKANNTPAKMRIIKLKRKEYFGLFRAPILIRGAERVLFFSKMSPKKATLLTYSLLLHSVFLPLSL